MSWCDWKYCWSGMVVRVLRVLLCAFTYGWEMVVIAFHLVWLGRTIWRLSKSDCSSRISANYTNGPLVVKHLSRLEIKKLVRKLANFSTTQLSESNICLLEYPWKFSGHMPLYFFWEGPSLSIWKSSQLSWRCARLERVKKPLTFHVKVSIKTTFPSINCFCETSPFLCLLALW